MDYLRSAYSTTIHAWDRATGEHVPAQITWFRAPSGALPLPVQHQYGSLNWSNRIAYPESVGEIIGDPRPYDKGATPNGLSGSQYCGTHWTGTLFRSSGPFDLTKWDQPSCCGDPSYCAPAAPLSVCRLAPSPSGAILTFGPRGNDIQTVADPVYPFLWRLQISPDPCGAYPSQNLLTAVTSLVHPTPLFTAFAWNDWDGSNQTWQVPDDAPYYAGDTFRSVLRDA